MRVRTLLSRGYLPFIAFLTATLAATPAFAKDEIDEYAAKAFDFLRQFQPAHLFGAALFFLIIGIIAKAREASALVIFGSFGMTGLCVAAFIVFALTGDMMRGRGRPRAARTTAAAAEPAGGTAEAPATPEPSGPANVGDACKKSADCTGGTVCARVAGVRNCWAPCSKQGQCDPGLACMGSTGGQMVCVR